MDYFSIKDTNLDFLPCPFCGENDNSGGLYIKVVSKTDKAKFKKNGIIHKRINISHCVWCGGCGANGGSSFSEPLDDDFLTEKHISDSIELAVLIWNTRHPINKKAYLLVNKLITTAIELIGIKDVNHD